MRKDFNTFKSGDTVMVIPDHPYLNTNLLTPGVIYTVDKMLSAAGVVTLKGLPWNLTFPDVIFIKVDN